VEEISLRVQRRAMKVSIRRRWLWRRQIGHL